MVTKDDIEAGVDLTDAELDAARMHLRRRLKEYGRLTGCTSYVQRNMGIGWSHAARILDALVAERFITEPDNAGERHFPMTEQRARRDRPATNPGGMQCENCDEVFVGEEWHAYCAICQSWFDAQRTASGEIATEPKP